MKDFHDKQKLKQYMTTKLQPQKILQGILHAEDENKQNNVRTEVLNLRSSKDKHSESSNELATHP
jgi:hypothetical protein